MSSYSYKTKAQLIDELERRDKVAQEKCSCVTTREYEGGYGMRTVYHYEDPHCPVHGS